MPFPYNGLSTRGKLSALVLLSTFSKAPEEVASGVGGALREVPLLGPDLGPRLPGKLFSAPSLLRYAFGHGALSRCRILPAQSSYGMNARHRAEGIEPAFVLVASGNVLEPPRE